MTVNVNYPLPTVHWNGTPQETLLKDAEKLSNAVDRAYAIVLEAMKDCEVGIHGRDYYVQDPMSQKVEDDTAFQRATKERVKHLENLRAFKQYNLEHVMHLRDSE